MIDSIQSQRGARVILVGRTGLDQSLRARPELELLRVRSTLEAIGELASPIDSQSPSRTAIVVGEDASTDDRDTSEFVRAARDLAPEVIVLGVGAAARGSRILDGAVSTDADLLRALGEDRSSATRASVTNGAACTEHGVTAAPPTSVGSFISSVLKRSGLADAASSTSGTGHEPGTVPVAPDSLGTLHDARMVETVLRGGDVLDVALSLLRERLKVGTVSFVPLPAATNGDASAPGGAAPVAYGRALLGFLIAPGIDSDALRPHAAWLAGWLRLCDQQSDLRHAAFTDPTTGAWNRRYFDRFLASAIENCRASRRTLTLMVFDIDDFKKYNDNHGHSAGDEILFETVRLMKSVVRPSDRVCRIGGDEFAVIFHEPEGPREANSRHPDSVCKIAQRFQQQVGRHRFPKLGAEAPGSLSISGGLATFPWDGSTAEQLLERADERALESKRSGKNALTLGPRAIRRED